MYKFGFKKKNLAVYIYAYFLFFILLILTCVSLVTYFAVKNTVNNIIADSFENDLHRQMKNIRCTVAEYKVKIKKIASTITSKQLDYCMEIENLAEKDIMSQLISHKEVQFGVLNKNGEFKFNTNKGAKFSLPAKIKSMYTKLEKEKVIFLCSDNFNGWIIGAPIIRNGEQKYSLILKLPVDFFDYYSFDISSDFNDNEIVFDIGNMFKYRVSKFYKISDHVAYYIHPPRDEDTSNILLYWGGEQVRKMKILTFLYIILPLVLILCVMVIIGIIFANKFIILPINQLKMTMVFMGRKRNKNIKNSDLKIRDFALFKNAFIHMVNRIHRRENDLISANERLKNTLKDLADTQGMLVQSEKMASLGKLTAGVAHEINNPLSCLGNNTEILAEYLYDIESLLNDYKQVTDDLSAGKAVDEDHIKAIKNKIDELNIEFILSDSKDLLSENIECTERLTKIVSSLKNFSYKTQDNNKPEKININEILDNVISISWNKLKKRVEVIKRFGDIPLIDGFSDQLAQVFLNLIVNAAQAIEGNLGRIMITTALNNNNDVVISIKDNGSGIPDNVKNKIFDPFFTTKTVGKGVGLGLSVVYKIVKNYKGDIKVNSELGKGSEFIITIPRNI